jgi:ATP-binding cassette subfamily F protein 3
MEAKIKASFPNIDPLVSEYSAGYLSHAAQAALSLPDDADTTTSPLDDASDAISALLLSATGDASPKNEIQVRNLVKSLIDGLTAAAEARGEIRRHVGARRLDQAIHVASQRNMSSTMALAGGNVDIESAGRTVESRVDRKKLEKAERKIAAKQQRKTMKNVEYEASRLLNKPDETQSYEEFYMSVNPLQLGSDSANKSKDIKINNFDVAISGLRILTDSNLSLAYGRRYGLVGQNGIGKSTLLRALSRREIAIPTHISILHVEQEVG